MFLPLFADSERAASSGLDFLKSELTSEFYTVAWPLDRALPLGDQRLQLLGNLDDAIGKLPPDTVIVLDATGSLRHDLALEVIAYVNHRREPLKASGLRLVLCWPAAFKDELLSNAPDLWSVRAASPWVEEADLTPVSSLPIEYDLAADQTNLSSISAGVADKLRRWQQHRDLKKANLSPRDGLVLANFQYSQLQLASAAEIAEAVFFEVNRQNNVPTDGLALNDALNFLSIARARLGNLTGALEASRLAVHNAQQFAKANPVANQPNLAMSINNLANRLSGIGDRPGALKAAQEAADIYKRLAITNPAVYEPKLAASINNLANRLSDTGDQPGALKAAQGAADIYRRLTKINPADYEPDLAVSINNLANFLNDAGDRSGALKAAQEAIHIRRRLAKTNPVAYEPGVATSINNLAKVLRDIGDHPGALKAMQEALDIRRRLAKTNPATYEPKLAGSINNLASFLSEAGDRSGALKAAQEAADIYRRLTKTNPAAYEPVLAMSLNNLANRLSETGDRPGALKAALEAVALYEKANNATPGAFAQQLAIAKRVRDGLA